MIVLGRARQQQWDERGIAWSKYGIRAPPAARFKIRDASAENGPLATMPSLLRLLSIVAVICAAVYGGLFALAHFVHPHTRDMSVSIPPDRFFKDR